LDVEQAGAIATSNPAARQFDTILKRTANFFFIVYTSPNTIEFSTVTTSAASSRAAD
jgi:hypothetical protein